MLIDNTKLGVKEPLYLTHLARKEFQLIVEFIKLAILKDQRKYLICKKIGFNLNAQQCNASGTTVTMTGNLISD